MAIDFPRSTYTAAEGVSEESWPASPSNGDTETNGAGDNFTFNGTSSLWVLDTGRTLTLSGGATYSWDGEKWIAQSHIPFRYFGPQSTDPTGLTADNEGDLYFNTVENEMRVYNGSSWDTITSVGNFNILTLSQSSGSGGGSATFNGTATRFQLSETPNVAQQLLISINGVVQEPQAGTSPTEGFAVDGNDIIFASAPATGSTFFGVQMGAAVNIGTPTDGSVTNVHVNASAAIAGSKISPDFGSQDIVTTGDVGIGTTSPLAKLQVRVNDSDDGGIFILNTNGATNSSADLYFGNWSGSTPTTPQARIQAKNTNVNTAATDLIFSIYNGTSTSERMRIDSSGRVKIGNDANYSAATGSKLAVELMGTAGTILEIADQTAGFSTLESVKNAGGGATDYGGYIFRGRRDADDDTKEYMRIDSSGRVGVGTNSPGAKLQIKDTLQATANQHSQLSIIGDDSGTVGESARIFLSAINATNRGCGIVAERTSSSNAHALIFQTNNDSAIPVEHMRIDSTGDVGIGTTDPIATLHVDCGSTNDTPAIFSTSNANGPHIRFRHGSSNLHYIGAAPGFVGSSDRDDLALRSKDNMIFATGDSTTGEKMRIDSSGNVGIGTTLPSAKLDVSGKTIVGSDSSNALEVFSNGDTEIGFSYSSKGNIYAKIIGDITVASPLAGEIAFQTATGGSLTERMRIDSSGRFRIRPFNLSFPSAGEYETPVFVCLEGTTDPASNAGAATGALVRIMDCGSSANASTGYEIRNRVSGDLRFLNKDSNISNRSNFLIYQDTDTNNLENTFSISYLAAVYAVGVYDHTTSSGANVNVAAGGQLRRSTSSIRFKTDVETLEDSYADALLNCRPVWYRSTAPADNPAHSHWGFIAEEIAEIDPRLVQWSTETTAFVDAVDDDGEPLFEQDGITRQKMRVKTTHEDPQPESVVYERFVPHLVNLIKRQKAQIEAMEARLTALEGGE